MASGDGGMSGRLTRRRAVIGLGALGAAGVGGHLGWRALRSPPSITVGGSLARSGPTAGIGEPLYRGLRHWAETVADAGGLAGREVTLEIVDDEGDPDQARAAFQDGVDGWDLCVAPYGTPATDAILDVVETTGRPCVAHTAGDRRLWADGRDWTVQLLNPVDTFLHAAIDVAHAAGARSLATVFRDDAFTPETMAGAVDRARTRDWTIREPVRYTDEAELEAAVGAALADQPDLLVGGGFQPGEPGGGFLPDAIALSAAYAAADGDTLACWSIGASFPDYAEGRTDLVDGTMGVTGWKPYVDYPGNIEFTDTYRDRWSTDPDSHAAQGYATGELYAAAVERAGSVAPGAVRDALFALETETVFGSYRVDERGLQQAKANAVIQWQDGTPVVVGPDRWQTGTLVVPGDR